MAEEGHGVLSKDIYAKIASDGKTESETAGKKVRAQCKSGKSAEIYYAKSNDMSKGLAQRCMLEL